MKRTYIDIIGKIHNYNYDTDDMLSKAKCNICNTKMNNIYYNRLGSQRKIGFICFNCNNVYIDSNFDLFKCKITIKLNKRINI